MTFFSSFINNVKAKINQNDQAAQADTSHGVPVFINVYNMVSFNKYISVFNAGVYHTGVEVHDIEYCYGGHQYESTGIFPMVPKHAESLGANYTLKDSIKIGYTDFLEADVVSLIENLGNEFKGTQYHLLEKNCNHFTEAFVSVLCGASIPSWINKLANISSNWQIIKNNIPPHFLTPQILMAQDNDCDEYDGSSTPPPPPQAAEKTSAPRRLSRILRRGSLCTQQSTNAAASAPRRNTVTGNQDSSELS